jgi:hypothetical protein
MEPPEEELLQQAAKEINPRPPEGAKAPLDRMRGNRLVGFDGLCVSDVLAKLIEVAQVPTRPVHKKAQDLLEDFTDGLTFTTLAHRTKKALKVWENPDPSEVAHKEAQTTPATQRFPSWLSNINSSFGTNILCGRLLHVNLPPNGLSMWNLCCQALYSTIPKSYPNGWDFFLTMNRSD